MEIWLIILAAVVALAIIAGLVLWARSRAQHTTKRLQGRFGSEYDATVGSAGRKKGEADLEHRAERVDNFELRPLAAGEAERFDQLWSAAQVRFVDDPGGAVSDADRLLSEATQARGYPVADFEQRAADISVNHPEFVANYRAAHAQAVKHSQGKASTEDLRQAMVHYRWLFADVVTQNQPASVPSNN
jgi:hypothetical protein